MTALIGIAVFLLGVGCCVAVRDMVEVDRIRRRAEMERLKARGDHDGSIKAACRPPEPGWLLILLSCLGGVAMVQGFFWFYESV